MATYLPNSNAPKIARDYMLVGTDPRGANIDPYTSEDQTDKLQWWLDQIAHRPLLGKPAAGYLPSGRYRKSDELTITPTDGHRTVTLLGAGCERGVDAPTIILDTADAGESKWSLAKPNTPGSYTIENMAFYANRPEVAKGDPRWAMRGVQVNNRSYIRRVHVNNGYRCGFGLKGDHIDIHDCDVGGNRFGVELIPGQDSAGDIRLMRVAATGCSQAGFAIAGDSLLAGFVWAHGDIGQAPFGIWRYPVAGGTLNGSNWMAACEFHHVATEYCGNEVVCDGVEDGAGIVGITWAGSSTDWGLQSSDHDWTYNGESKPQRAAWYNAGSVSLIVETGFPGSATPSIPAIRSNNLVGSSAPRSGRYVLPLIVNQGFRPYRLDHTNANRLAHIHIGSASGGSAVLLVPYLLTEGTVAYGELLTNSNEYGAKKYAGTGRVIGVASHSSDSADATSKTCHAMVSGHMTETKLKNTSGGTIAANALLKPHPSGGVQVASSMSDGQVIGRYTASTADGALGEAELFGMN